MPSYYAHWLDGEVLLLNALATKRTMPTVDEEVARHLKLLALMGDSFWLSDAQLIDSSTVLRQFADDGFRAFLRMHPGFLRFAAQSKADKPTALDLVDNAFERARAPKWDSAIFGGSSITLRLAEATRQGGDDPNEILDERNPKGIAPLRREFPQFAKYFRGMVYAIHEFAHAPATRYAAVPPAQKLTSLLDVLVEAQASPGLAPEHESTIADTLSFIRRSLPDPIAQQRRSDIVDCLGPRTSTPEYSRIWHTVVHAWNVAVQRTVAPEGGSVACLSMHAAPIGLIVDDLSSAFLPLSEAAKTPWWSADRLVGVVDKDPTRLTWPKVGVLWRRTEETRVALVLAREGRDELALKHALSAHLRALNKELVPWATNPTVGLVGIVGTLFFAFGAGVAIPATAIAGGVQALSVTARRYWFANTLRGLVNKSPLEVRK